MRRLLAAATLLLMACRPEAQASDTPRPIPAANPAPLASALLPASDPRLRFEGRIDDRDPRAPVLAWPATAVNVRFIGRSLRMRLRDVPFADAVRDADRLAVFVDASAPRTLVLAAGESDYLLADGLPFGEHRVRLVKRTEAEAGSVVVLGLAVGPGGRLLAAEPAPTRRILAIGDSITVGYGVDGPDARCHGSAETTDATTTYVAHAARALAAELQVVAWSGRGVLLNYDARETVPMPALFERLVPGESAPGFVPARFEPHAIVVNLGTNDAHRPELGRAAFSRAYEAFLDRLRAAWPEAFVVVAYGPMLSDDHPPGAHTRTRMRSTLESLVARRNRRGDPRIAALELPPGGPSEGYGCDYHPSRRTHLRLGDTLASALRQRLGW